jgi:hypothetical protein
VIPVSWLTRPTRDRDRAVSTHPVFGDASSDSARVDRCLRGHALGGVPRADVGTLD